VFVLALLLAVVGLATPAFVERLDLPDASGGAELGGQLSPNGPRYEVARVLPGQRIELRDAPDGAVIKELGAKTEFNSPRTFYVAERPADAPGWLGVPSAELPNGELGWIHEDPGRLQIYETSYSIDADLSAGELSLHWGKRTLVRFPVTVGRPGSETPAGTFSVTDGLAGAHNPAYYGCCVLALSGHQPNLPEGWIGGDRIAIHGTDRAIGGASSSGCLRASDPDMVSLFALVPLGTPVFIRE
jgi:hypothetical protein